MKKTWLIRVHYLLEEIFQYALITYFIFLLAETGKEGFVSYYFNPDILLLIVLVSGIGMALTHSTKEHTSTSKNKNISVGYVVFTLLFSLGGGIFLLAGIEELGNLALLLAGITCIMLFLFSLLIVTEKK